MKRLLLLILIVSSCDTIPNNEKNEGSELFSQLDSIMTIPYPYKNTSLLNPLTYNEEKIEEKKQKHTDSLYKEAYQLLKESKIFREKGLNGSFGRIAVTILSQQKKYKELDSLLKSYRLLSDFEKQLALNSNHFFMFRSQDSTKAIKYLKKNDKIIQDKLPENINKEDSKQINLLNIFIQNKAMLYGKEIGHKTIDSLTKEHKDLEEYNKSMKNQCDYFMKLMQLDY